MPRRPNLLNVRQHLEYVQDTIETLQKYGMCPLVQEELPKLSLLNRAIMRKHDAARKAGNRKDIYLESPK